MKVFGGINRLFIGALVTGCVFLGSAMLQGAEDKPAGTAVSAAKPAPAPVASYVGSASCKACHPKVCEPWSDSAHGKALTQDSLPADLKGCEACHGPASIHISSGAKNKLSVPKADDAAGTNAVCGKCHFESDTSKAPKEWQKVSGRHFARNLHGRKGLSCVSCHTGHANGNVKALIKSGKDLCLNCHGKVLESSPGKKAAYTHAPVAQGECVTCHNPHGTSDRTMVVSDIQQICRGCHEPTDAKLVAAHKDYPIADSKCTECHDPHSHKKDAHLVRTKQHMPFKQGKCETCHTKPSPGQPVGLVKPAKELCLSCHPASVMTPEKNRAHPPVKEGLCTSCHSPHASSEEGLLKARLANVCFGCHSKVEGATAEEHKHKVLEGNMNCMMCHKPHSSPEEHTLVKEEVALCTQCHKHSFSHPLGKRADGSVINDPTTGKPMVCASCHEVHGGKFESLTTGEKSRELCVRCHSQDHS